VRYRIDKVSVIGKQYQTFGFGVQSSSGNQSCTGYLDQIGHFLFGMTIRDGGNIACRFIQSDIIVTLRFW
jgi:hypothetical protein